MSVHLRAPFESRSASVQQWKSRQDARTVPEGARLLESRAYCFPRHGLDFVEKALCVFWTLTTLIGKFIQWSVRHIFCFKRLSRRDLNRAARRKTVASRTFAEVHMQPCRKVDWIAAGLSRHCSACSFSLDSLVYFLMSIIRLLRAPDTYHEQRWTTSAMLAIAPMCTRGGKWSLLSSGDATMVSPCH